MNNRIPALIFFSCFSTGVFAAMPNCDWDPTGGESACGDGLTAVGTHGTPDLLNVVLHPDDGEDPECEAVVICNDDGDITHIGYNEVVAIPPVGQEGIIRSSFRVDTEAFQLSNMQSTRFMSLSYKDQNSQAISQIHFDLVKSKTGVSLRLTDSWNARPKSIALQSDSYVRIGSSARNGGQLQYFYVVVGASSGGVGGELVMRSAVPIPASEIPGALVESPHIVYTSLHQQQYLRYGYLGGTKAFSFSGFGGGGGSGGFDPVPVSALHDFKIELIYQPIN